jgi:predicted nucleic acid-binding protein
VILPDLNLLLYAYNPHLPQHDPAHGWWEKTMNGEELIGLPLEVWAIVAIRTRARRLRKL